MTRNVIQEFLANLACSDEESGSCDPRCPGPGMSLTASASSGSVNVGYTFTITTSYVMPTPPKQLL